MTTYNAAPTVEGSVGENGVLKLAVDRIFPFDRVQIRVSRRDGPAYWYEINVPFHPDFDKGSVDRFKIEIPPEEKR